MTFFTFASTAVDLTRQSPGLMVGVFVGFSGLGYVFLTRLWTAISLHRDLLGKLRQTVAGFELPARRTSQKHEQPWGVTIPFVNKIYRAYQLLGLRSGWNRFLMISVLLLFFSFTLLTRALGSGILGLTITILVAGFLAAMLLLQAQKKRARLIDQVPTFLRAVSNALQAGYSLEQALLFVSQEMAEPLHSSLQSLTRNIKLGLPLVSNFRTFTDTLEHRDMDFLADSVELQSRRGGNLIALFHQMSDLIDERQKLERDIKAFTSQGKMSGILIAGLWPASLLLFSWMSPQHMDLLLHTPAGKAMLSLALMLEAIGFWLIWKIVNVRI